MASNPIPLALSLKFSSNGLSCQTYNHLPSKRLDSQTDKNNSIRVTVHDSGNMPARVAAWKARALSVRVLALVVAEIPSGHSRRQATIRCQRRGRSPVAAACQPTRRACATIVSHNGRLGKIEAQTSLIAKPTRQRPTLPYGVPSAAGVSRHSGRVRHDKPFFAVRNYMQRILCTTRQDCHDALKRREPASIPIPNPSSP